jgi:molybdopterin synthase catalytic subunit
MAEKKMAEIGDAVKARWHIDDIAVLHRIGRLEIGEISVLIAVGSPHRAEAFEVCRYFIDRLKEIVPIWKKEVGQDGEVWIEGPQTASAGV